MRRFVSLIGGLLFTFVAAATADEPPKYEAFLGFTYVRANQFNQNFGLGQTIGGFSMYGGTGQFQYNFNKWISGVIEAGAVNKPNVGIINASNTTAFTLGGPRIYWRHGRWSPFAEVLFGAAYRHLSTGILAVTEPTTPIIPVANPSNLFPGPDTLVSAQINETTTAFALQAGGGLDYRLGKYFSLRPVEVDYLLTRFPSLSTGFRANQSSIWASTGMVFTFGGEQPAPPPPPAAPATKKCPDGSVVPVNQACPKLTATFGLTATPTDLCEGETAQVTVTNNAPSSAFAYMWSINGQLVGQTASQQPSFTFDSTGKPAGTYQIAVKATGNGFNPASAETTISVRAYEPPMGTVQANPAQIHAGDTSMLAANFTGQCGGPIQPPTFEASEGTVQGDTFNSAGVQFDPNNNAEQHKTVTITAKAADNRSTGTATTTIDVIKEAAPAAAIRLPDVLFGPNNSRVNNCGKRILLEQLRSYVERDPGGKVVLVGHASSDEASGIAEKRAQNAAAVITAGTGVCLSVPASQVEVSWPGVEQNGVGFESGFCASSVGGALSVASQMRRVEVWFVPSGGNLPASVTNNQSASTLSLSGLGCPR